MRRSGIVLVRLVLILLALGWSRPAAAGPWVRVQSAHFVVSGNGGERQTRDVAARLEQFREILLRLFPSARLAVRPLVVVAFDSETAYRPFKPLQDGKPAPVAGYFVGNSDGGCVTLQLDRGEESYPIIFHEYAHLFIAEAARTLPPWLTEGIAEYYSTVEVHDDGQEASIARPVARHIQLLRHGFLPLRDVLTTTKASALWGKPEDLALFYAESWALVHYLSSQRGGASRLATLIQHLSAGRPDVEAFEDTFGPIAATERDLRHYMQQSAYPYWQYRFPNPVNAERAPARRMTDAEVNATLATLLVHLGRFDEAAARVADALAAEPELPAAHAARGLLELRQGRSAEAEKAFRAAVVRAPRDLDAAYYWGLSLLEQPDARLDSLEQALQALTVALPPEDAPADVLTVLGVLQGQAGRLNQAEATLRRSMELAPGRIRTSAGLADILIREGKFAEARGILGPMASRPNEPVEAEVARRQLAWLAAEEVRAKEREELARAAAARGAAKQARQGEAERMRPGTRGYLLNLRPLAAGEQRTLGLLEKIDCTRGAIVFELRTGDGLLRFYAARFDAVEFVAYREDLGGRVPCGPRETPEPVYVTWVVADEVAPSGLGKVSGRATAVAFLPKDYPDR